MTEVTAYLRFYSRHHLLGLLASLRLSGNTHINGIGLGIGGNSRIVAMQQFIQSLLDSRLSQAGDAKDACKDQAPRIGSEPGDSLLFPHAIHLSWHARHGNNDMLIFLNPP